MPAYRIVAIPQKTADRVRETRTSPGYGHPAHAETARSYGPCRLCLQFFAVGEDTRLLFTHDPFHATGDAPLPGPVFVHEKNCDRYPEHAGFPTHLLEHPLTLVAYGEGRRMLAEEPVENGEIETMLESLLGRPDVRYVHVRDTSAGCFDCRVERSDAASVV